MRRALVRHRPRPGILRRAAWLACVCLAQAGCASHAPLHLPPLIASPLPVDYRMQADHGLVLARVTAFTEGKPGFGSIANRLLVQLLDNPRNDQRLGWVPHWSAAIPERAAFWLYEGNGLMAVAAVPGAYNEIDIAYPEVLHGLTTGQSIPWPSHDLVFAPITIPPGQIVYIGDITILQAFSWWDMASDRIEVSYAIADNYDTTVAAFRARFPQLAGTPVLHSVIEPR
jgi:hypothetical protein